MRRVDFGARDYQQYKDRTPLGLYSHKNHDRKRVNGYFSRHSGAKHRYKAIEKEKKNQTDITQSY